MSVSKAETPSGQPPEEEFDEELELALIEMEQARFIDKYGHEHGASIFLNWTPAARKALGIHRKDDGGGAK
jgi:hypothetical protein